MMSDLFELSKTEYQEERKVSALRQRIYQRTLALGIIPVYDERGHHYKFPDSTEYRSVTSKLQVIKDEGLMNWKMNRALGHIRKYWLPNQPLQQLEIDTIITDARNVPQQEFQGAGDIGSTVHNWREKWFGPWISRFLTVPPPIQDTRPAVLSAIQGIRQAVQDHKVQPLACELALADRTLQVGGMLDDLWFVGGQIWLVDLKTSNIGNKNSYYMQVAAYWYMFRKLYKIKVDRLFILHVSKEVHGKYDLIELKHPNEYWQMAKTAFKLSDDLLYLEELKIPVINKI